MRSRRTIRFPARLPPRMAILEFKSGADFGLDQVGATVWNLIAQPRRVIEIRDALLRPELIYFRRSHVDRWASLDSLSIAMLSTNMPAKTLSDDSRISVSEDQVSCDLAGEAAILNLKNSVYYGLDPVGARVWSLIQEPKTFAEIRDTLLGVYDVERPQLESDLQVLLTELAEQGLIDIQT